MITTMAAPRGRQQRGKAAQAGRPVRAGLLLNPGDDVRTAYEWLIAHEGVSGAEVIRRALLDRYEHKKSAPQGAEGGRMMISAT